MGNPATLFITLIFGSIAVYVTFRIISKISGFILKAVITTATLLIIGSFIAYLGAASGWWPLPPIAITVRDHVAQLLAAIDDIKNVISRGG